MNILFVHEVDWQRKVVFEIHTLAEYLSLLGHKVFAIDYESMWINNSPFDLIKKREVCSVSRVYPEASITLIRPGFIKVAVLSRISAFFTHYFQIGRTIREKKIDAIVLYSVPTNGLQTLYLANKYDVPVIFRAIDALNQMVKPKILSVPTRFLERAIYSRVSRILTLSPKLSEYVIKLGAPHNRVGLLPLGVDSRQFKPSIDSSNLRNKWAIKGEEQVILYMGTLFDFCGMDDFLAGVPLIKREIPRVKVVIVGDGPMRSRLEKIIGQLDIVKDVVITGFQPFSTMPAYINMATICVNPFLITEATRDIFPGKIIQFLACGKVVVALPLPGMKAVLPEKDTGVVFSSNVAAMSQDVINLIKSDDYRHNLEEKAIIYIRHNHSYDKIAHQLETTLEEAIKKKHE